MATLRDDALTEYNWKLADDAAKAQAKIDALNADARAKLATVLTDHTGKVVLDTASKTTVELTDQANSMVILTTTDGSALSFAVYTVRDITYLTKQVDGEWTQGPVIKDLDDLGKVLSEGGGY